ncbi:hypothetical protein HKCCE3408_15290 [Rhodobacterales bacterium HKCCE3408]|nr:hypothetical protein [Rhodobacterales bacterium HKCCE3408]
MTDEDDDILAGHFAAARAARDPGDDLVARVLSDAARVQAEAAKPRPVPRTAPGRGGIVRALGGWIAVSGLAAACAAGVAIGAYLPDTIDDATGGVFSATLGTASVTGYAGIDAVELAAGVGGLE